MVIDMTISDGFMITAVVLGPILAVQVQKFIEKWNEARGRKLGIFKTLMATRGARLSPQHVQALNMIDLEFSSDNPKEKTVLDAWKTYLEHLYNVPRDSQDPNYQTKFTLWDSKSSEYLIALLSAMGKSAGFVFDEVQLKKGAYTPQGYIDLETENSLIRRGTLDILYGRRPLQVKEVVE
jgi:hypothetical protein